MREQKLQFLEEKLKLMRPYIEPQFGEMLQQLFAQLRPKLDLVDDETFRSGDAELEKRLTRSLASEKAVELRKTLIERFGFCRLGEDVEQTIKRVLTRGRIANDSEAAVAISRLGDQLHPGFGSADHARLGKILASYETRKK